MSSENISSTIDNSEDSSTTTCSRLEDGSDSTNSLLNQAIDNNGCVKNCVDVECSLANQCSMSCTEDSHLNMERRRVFCCNSILQSVWGVLLILVSIGAFVFTPLDFMLLEKLNMRPGFPPFEWWADPPDEVRLRVYVFNVTNHQRFLDGLDLKINVQEIGPIVYLEKLRHSNITFNDNSTMTYTATRFPIFLPEDNHVDLNATLIVPNLAVLGIASYLHNAAFFLRGAFRFLVNSHGSQLFVRKTVQEYLWEYRDPVLDTSQSLVPGLVPVSNMGMLARIYNDFVDSVTVHIGPQWGHDKFFQIQRYHGAPQLPGYDPDTCPDRIFGSTEGVMYHQRLQKSDVLLYWRKTVCKLMPLHFNEEMIIDGVPVYRYNLSAASFQRVANGTDCYNTEPSLPEGISDASKCYYDFPMVVSYPHFYTGQPAKDRFVTGLQPDPDKHNSYIIAEPLTGIPFRSVARMQSNLRIHDLSSFGSQYARFSNSILPLFWAEYNQEGLPQHISSTIYFMTVVLPPLSTSFFAITLLIGSCLVLKRLCKNKLRQTSLKSMLDVKSKNARLLANNKILTFEKEKFLQRKDFVEQSS